MRSGIVRNFALALLPAAFLAACSHSQMDPCSLEPLRKLRFADLDERYDETTRPVASREIKGEWKLVAKLWRSPTGERTLFAEDGVFNDRTLGDTFETITFYDEKAPARKLGVRFKGRTSGSSGVSGDVSVPDSAVERSGDAISGYSDGTGRKGDIRVLKDKPFLILGDRQTHQYQIYQRAHCKD